MMAINLTIIYQVWHIYYLLPTFQNRCVISIWVLYFVHIIFGS